MSSDETEQWREKRRLDALAQAEAAAHRRAEETEQARGQVAQFARDAPAAGLTVSALKAEAYGGRAHYRTGLRGWRIQRSGLLAISVDGVLYDLSVPARLGALVTGVRLEPHDPPLIVGVGGRDGTSMPLAELLAIRLAAGDDW